MNITTTIKAQVRVVASLEADTDQLTVKTFASGEYAKGRTGTSEVGTHEIPADLQSRLKDVLKDIQKAAERTLATRLQHSLFKATEVARSMGEL